MSECWHLRLDSAARHAVHDAAQLHATLEDGDYAALAREDYGTHPRRLDADQAARMLAVVVRFAPTALIQRPALASAIRDSLARVEQDRALGRDDLTKISEACELLSRAHHGQWDIVAEKLGLGDVDDYSDLRDGLSRRVNPAVPTHACSEIARNAWDVHQVIRRHLAYLRHPEGGWQVIFDPPLRTGTAALARLEPAE